MYIMYPVKPSKLISRAKSSALYVVTPAQPGPHAFALFKKPENFELRSNSPKWLTTCWSAPVPCSVQL